MSLAFTFAHYTKHELEDAVFDKNMDSSVSASETSEVALLFVFVLSFVCIGGRCIYKQYFFDVVRNHTLNKSHLDIIRTASKVQDKNISYERALNFEQWLTFSENYKSLRVWLLLVYKLTRITVERKIKT